MQKLLNGKNRSSRELRAAAVVLGVVTMAKDLPEEMRNEILLRVPIKDLVRFRCVCKNWLQLLSKDSYFFELLLQPNTTNNTSILVFPWTKNFLLYYPTIDEHKPVKFEYPFKTLSEEQRTIYHPECVCNGMICFTSFDHSPVHVWNPLTNDHITIPCPDTPYHYKCYSSFVSFGFVFHQDANEYKLIRLVHNSCFPPRFLSHVSIYVLGTGAWRSLEDNVLPYVTSCSNSFAPFINGALHWVAIKFGVPLILLSFDTRNEVFQEIALPNNFRYKAEWGLNVTEFGGLLCVNYVLKDLYIWLMLEYGVVESWTMQFRIRGTDFQRAELSGWLTGFKLLGLASNGHILMKTGHHRVVLYNPETKFFGEHKVFYLEPHCVLLFKASIVSPGSYHWRRIAESRTKSLRRREKYKFQIAINSFFKSCCSCTDTS